MSLRLLGVVIRRPFHCLILHISFCLFLVGNDNKLVQIKQVHYKKLHALEKDSSIGTHNPDKVIFNYPSH